MKKATITLKKSSKNLSGVEKILDPVCHERFDPDLVCLESLHPDLDPVCHERLNPDPVNIRLGPKPCL